MSSNNICKSLFTSLEIKCLVSNEYYEKYKRFKAIKENPNFRECPKCQSVSLSGSDIQPIIICIQCNYQFCFIHDDAHPNNNCIEYTNNLSNRIRKELNETELSVKKTTKICPNNNCNAPTEKNGGCNHM